MVTWCPSLTTLKMSTATKNLLFRSLRNNFSNIMFRHIQNISKFANDWILSDIQTGGLHLVYRLRIPANLTWHAWVFTLSRPEFAETSRWLPKTFWRLQNIAENVRRCSEDVWALPKLLYKTTTIFRALISLEHKKGYKVIIYHLFGLNFHNLSCVTEH